MEKKHLFDEEAARVGCIVSLIGFVSIPLVLGLSSLYFSVYYVIIVIPVIMTSALIGRYFTKTQAGAWFGVLVGTILGFQLLTWALQKYFGFGFLSN